MSYIDAILHISDIRALVGWFSEDDPSRLSEDSTAITGFARTPTRVSGLAALVYVRVTPEDETAFRNTLGVTVLAREDFAGPGTPDAVYAALFADAGATALYDAVYDRSPYQVNDGEGGSIRVTPPERFGQLN